MIFSMTLVYYTYIYLGVLAALRGFDGQLEEAGLSLAPPRARPADAALPASLAAPLAADPAPGAWSSHAPADIGCRSARSASFALKASGKS
ncbi:hypothetical protein L503_3310 [Bordetella holmesii CDC-H809-BH]|nr:hypothetical protein L503_2829 [Bordetella holmesii CDC-H809-BH]KAK79131.1 hypothetical protein L503_0340 [Bordetella holmesii CDC-H809-BH]KAK79246.1 hypothetical protein L503_0081 [Bordetella holmesii CDC-H809-BH]KAK79279.1 hypothetical protein L503_1434 [Bordetella holmesii CDC-H809-BH]KAK81121.1 hypothetical protein L503_1132 [Bordetella holmesii CDC-H809-BH]